MIRDLSASGARIQVRSSVQLPEEFNLLLLEANTSRHVVLKWRAGDFAGIAFSQTDATPSPPNADTRREKDAKPASVRPEGSPPSSNPTEAGPDMRIAPRRRVLGHCLVIAPDLHASGIIRDVSATGAKLGVPSRVKLPQEFHVVDPKTNSARRVSLRWRDGDLAGVQFCEPTPTRGRENPADTPSVWHV
jgi:hypothetical protein